MGKRRFDVIVVGAGPAGSTSALVLARGGARVALVDKATFPRDKACGDLVGPRGLALLAQLGLTPPPDGREVGEMVVLGPTGRRVVLPARAGLTYPGHGVAITRRRFDAWLRDEALAAGAEPVVAHVADLAGPSSVVLDDGTRLDADVVVGADGARSALARRAGLIDPHTVLWGFAYRGYAAQHVERPVIALWDETPRRGFPGYGWIFPGEDGTANIGLGLGLGPAGARRASARAVERFTSFCSHLRDHGLLASSVEERRLGGWLKMGMVGTIAARDRLLLVGDAAGLVNPLQGEGIAPAMTSAAAAASAILADPSTAARRYHAHLRSSAGRFATATAPIHIAASSTPRRVAVVGRVLTAPGLGALVAAPWALLWNDLADGAPPGASRTIVRAALALSRTLSQRSAVAQRLADQFADP
ncbi:MAG: geranylgeranyl reductase [Ilumatobacteraceae bacterium]|nr:geranylgeranyl reductase [Ilumatobacteraceae bacterium]